MTVIKDVALVHQFSAPRGRVIFPCHFLGYRAFWMLFPADLLDLEAVSSSPTGGGVQCLRPSQCVESIQSAKAQFPEEPAAETVYTIVRNADYQVVGTDPSQAN